MQITAPNTQFFLHFLYSLTMGIVFYTVGAIGPTSSFLVMLPVQGQIYRLIYTVIYIYIMVFDRSNIFFNTFFISCSSLLFNHRKSYEVKDLRPDAEYECLVQARNKFGWSDASRIFHFFSGKSRKSICSIYYF